MSFVIHAHRPENAGYALSILCFEGSGDYTAGCAHRILRPNQHLGRFFHFFQETRERFIKMINDIAHVIEEFQIRKFRFLQEIGKSRVIEIISSESEYDGFFREFGELFGDIFLRWCIGIRLLLLSFQDNPLRLVL